MQIVQSLFERPHLRRYSSLDQFADPLNCLREEAVYLRLAANILDDLACNVQLLDREERAASVLDYLSLDLCLHVGDIEALVALLEMKTAWDEAARVVCNELRDEHRAIQRLLSSVTAGLTTLSGDTLPSSPRTFVVSALILSEFLRMHIEFEKSSVLTLAKSVLTRQDLADLGREMAYRRGMGPAQ